MNALALCLTLISGAAPELNTPQPHPVPVWLPRGASLGLFINPDERAGGTTVVAPHLRLQWDVTLYEANRDAFVGVLALGTGLGAGLPTGMTAHYQHVALGGVGYRNTAELFHWGFQLTFGPVWYRTAYAPGSRQRFESRVVGYAEGRFQVGLRLLPNFVLGIYLGYASPFFIPYDGSYPGTAYVGGFDLGVFADWR